MINAWTPDDEDARRLLDQRIESYDVDAESASWWERVLAWLNDALALNVDATGAGGIVIQLLLVLAVVLLVVLLVKYFRPRTRTDAAQAADALADPAISAQQYLDRAEQYLAREHFEAAFLHAYRSMVRTVAQRDLAEISPATTATALGRSLGRVLPELAPDIATASQEFNTVFYGGHIPSRATTETMLQLARTVAVAQPHATTSSNDSARLMPR